MGNESREGKESGLVTTFKGLGRLFGWLIKFFKFILNLPLWPFLRLARKNVELKTKLELREWNEKCKQDNLSPEEKKSELKVLLEENIDRHKKSLIIPEIIYGLIAIGAAVAAIVLFVNPLTLLTIGLPISLGIGVAFLSIRDNFYRLKHDERTVIAAIEQVREICEKDDKIQNSELDSLITEIEMEMLANKNPQSYPEAINHRPIDDQNQSVIDAKYSTNNNQREHLDSVYSESIASGNVEQIYDQVSAHKTDSRKLKKTKIIQSFSRNVINTNR